MAVNEGASVTSWMRMSRASWVDDVDELERLESE